MQLKRSKLVATAGILGAGGLSLALMGSGVGANFVKHVTGNAHISVGNLACEVTNPTGNPAVTISSDHLTATVSLPQIESSAPGSATMPVGVANTGDMPLYVNWVVTTSGNLFDSGAFSAHPVTNGAELYVGQSQNYNLGFDWTALSNADLTASGTATYTASCTDTRSNLSLFQQSGGTASWSSDGTSILLGIPSSPLQAGGAGIQLNNPPSALPATEPIFTTDHYAAGSPRWYIKFTDGSSVFGYPASFMGTNNWEESTSPNSYMTWNQVMNTAYGTKTVSLVQIIMDISQPGVTDTISYIQYNGTVLLGTNP